MKRSTRKDVAKRAGVSPAVVSFVINNSGYVSKEKRERVQKAIEELDYQPNLIARSLKTKKSNLLIFVTNDIRNNYFVELAYELEQYAYNKGYIIMTCNARNDKEFLDRISNYQAAGIIISSDFYTEEQINTLANKGNKIVLLSGNTEYKNLNKNISTLSVDLYSNVKLMLNELIHMGHRKIIFLHRQWNMENESIKLKAYKDALEENNLDFDEDLIIYYNNDSLHYEILEIVEKIKEVTAFIAWNDMVAIKTIQILKSLGYNLPNDYSIVGIDDITLAKEIYPKLTTIHVQKKQVAKEAVDILMGNKSDDKIIVIKSQIIRRDSCSILSK